MGLEVITIQRRACFDRDNKAMSTLIGKIPEAVEASGEDNPLPVLYLLSISTKFRAAPKSSLQQPAAFKMSVQQRGWGWGC